MKDSEYRQQLMQLIQTAYPEGLPHGCLEVINISFQDGKSFSLRFDRADYAAFLATRNKADSEMTEEDRAFLKDMRISTDE